jgi:DNA-binding response OmpR family regulator
VIDKVLALEMGANDYMTKPFEPRELMARVRVQLRRSRAITVRDPAQRLCSSGIVLDLASYRVRFHDRPVELAKMELELLRLFLEHPDQVLSRREIMNKVWGTGNYQTTRTIDNHVSALRHKFEASLFEAVRGVGYRFSPKP